MAFSKEDILYMVIMNISQMCKDRNLIWKSGLSGPLENIKKETLKDINFESLDSLYIDNNNEQTHIFFIETKNGSLVDFTKRLKFFSKTKPGNKTRTIIVSEISPLTSQRKPILDQFSEIPPQFFVYGSKNTEDFNIFINPIIHDYVPKHRLLNDSELSLFSKVSLTQLPVILSTDPICRWYGALPGQIFEITRSNFTVNNTVSDSIYYRIVK